MEIISSIVHDLNRYLNLGLYLMADGNVLVLGSLTTGKSLVVLNASQTLDFYKKLVELQRLVKSWDVHRSTDRKNMTARIAYNIFLDYKFDIDKHFQYKKYGTY